MRRYDLRKATACEVVDFARLRFVVRRPKDKRGDLEFLAPSSEILREASARWPPRWAVEAPRPPLPRAPLAVPPPPSVLLARWLLGPTPA